MLITESAGKGASAGMFAKSLWLLSCSSQRVQVKELQLVCLAKSEVVELLITESAGEGTSAGVFG